MILHVLESAGWWLDRGNGRSRDATTELLEATASSMGVPLRGRGGRTLEELRPTPSAVAHPKSLSAEHGLGAMPPHVDLAHRARPCRFVVLACLESDGRTPTILVDGHRLPFDDRDRALLESAPVLVRTGRRSFYSTILSRHRRFLRYDPDCVEAVDPAGAEALDIMARGVAASEHIEIDWSVGDVLVIDNWRMLHGRGATDGASRTLVRICVDAG